MKNKYLDFLYPSIIDKQSAIKAASYGYIAAGFIAVLTLFNISMQFIDSGSNDYVQFLSKFIADVLPTLILGYFIYKMSRIASVLALMLCLIEIFYKFSGTGSVGILPIFLIFYLSSVRGTFALKKLENEEVK